VTEGDSYCRKLIARFDRDRYLCTQFAPAERRADLFALYAFNLEIAGVRESVSDPLVGQMRLKWWYDSLDAIVAGSPPRQPVAEPLAEAVRRHGLPRAELETLIEARSDDLEAEQPVTLSEFEAYAERSSAPLLRLALAVLGGGGPEAQDLCRSTAVAWALGGHLRAVPHHAAQRRLYLPRDLCRETGLDHEAVYARRADDPEPAGLTTVVRGVADAAYGHIETVRASQTTIPSPARSLLLYGTLTRHYLGLLAAVGYDPYRMQTGRPGPGVSGLLKLFWAGLRRRA